jgi:hypothetical protein
MNTIENTTSEESISQARSQRVSAVAWLTGVTAVCALGFLSNGATVGTGIGVIGIAAMVSVVSYFLLKY